MKKLAVLTLCFDNYGTRLQSFALCKVLKSVLGDSVQVDVVNIEGTWSTDLASFGIKELIKQSIKGYGWFRCWSHIFDMFRWRQDSKILRKQEHHDLIEKRIKLFESINKKIPYTKEFYTCNDIREGKLPMYDSYIVGSDQVWNGIRVKNQDIFMLDFAKTNRGLTYAASFGMTNIPLDMVDDYRRRINNFESLLIREQEGVDICKQLGRQDAKYVLDPTLLLTSENYDELIEEVIVEGKYVLVYSLNQSYNIFDETYKLCKRNGYKMVVLKRGFNPPMIDRYKGAIELYAVSPGGFLWLIKHAQCIVTNSYHALIFSITYNSPFYLYLDNANEENSRLHTICNLCKLENRIYWETGHLPYEIKAIEYRIPNEILANERENSLDLLKGSLKNNGVI